MKKLLAMMLACLTALSLVACSGNSNDSSDAGDSGDDTTNTEAIVLKAGMSGNETSPTYVALSEFKRLVEERTEGRYVIEIYTNDQLSSGDQMKAVEMGMNNTIDIEMHAGSLWGTYVPQMQVVSTPFLFSSYEDADKLVLDPESEGYQLIEGWLAEKGVHTLGILEQGFRQLSNSKKEIVTPDDIKGMKFRVPQTSILIDAFDTMGASASPMSFSEVYTALQQGTIDGQENPLSAMVTGKFEEVQKYVTMWNYSYDIFVLNASGKVWDSLSDEDKAIFDGSAARRPARPRSLLPVRLTTASDRFGGRRGPSPRPPHTKEGSPRPPPGPPRMRNIRTSLARMFTPPLAMSLADHFVSL